MAYAELIFLLTRVKLDSAEARNHWDDILAHWSELGAGLGRAVDVRVGLVSYYLDVNRCLQQPKLVEMDWVEHAVASAYTDELTSLPNYRFFREHLRREVARARRDSSPVSLVLLDVDDFRLVNERLGHEGGNTVLASMAKTLRANIRAGDLVARYGGEEFVLLLPSTSKVDAKRFGDRLRFAVARNLASGRHGEPSFTVTASLGVATCPADAKEDTDLIVAADRALYEAKAAGKNQVRLFGGSSRSYARRKATWSGHVRVLEPVAHPIQTVEIGERGFMFVSGQDFPKETLVETVLTTPNGGRIRVAGRVAWSRLVGPGQFEIALRSIEQASGDSELLARWVSTAAETPPPLRSDV